MTPDEQRQPDVADVVRSEEELRLRSETVESGRAKVHKHVDTHHVTEAVSRSVERAEMERIDVAAGDSGEIETLPDGSISIPVYEEQLVIEKRIVLRERVIIRKVSVTEEQLVEADLRRERVDVHVDAPPDVDADRGRQA